MKIKKGDKVRFLNDVGGGIVTRIVDNETVMILRDDDFEVPVLVIELVKIDNYETEVLPKEEKDEEIIIQEETEEEISVPYIEGNDELKMYAAFVPTYDKEQEQNTFDLYLINDSNYQSFINVSWKQQGDSFSLKKDYLEANTKLYLKSLKSEDLSNTLHITFQALFFGNGAYNLISPLDKTIDIHPKKFYQAGSFVEKDYFHEDALMILLNDNFNTIVENISDEKLEQLKRREYQNDLNEKRLRKKYKVSSSSPAFKEVNLHIEELIDNHSGMSNGEIVQLQIQYFHQELSKATKDHNIKRIVFIHGVGKGVLKAEIRGILKKEYPYLDFQDASYQEYGYGATMVILRKL